METNPTVQRQPSSLENSVETAFGTGLGGVFTYLATEHNIPLALGFGLVTIVGPVVYDAYQHKVRKSVSRRLVAATATIGVGLFGYGLAKSHYQPQEIKELTTPAGRVLEVETEKQNYRFIQTENGWTNLESHLESEVQRLRKEGQESLKIEEEGLRGMYSPAIGY